MPETIEFIDPYNAPYSFTDNPRVGLLPGVQGRHMPPITHTEDEVPLQPGGRLRQVNIKTRELDLPILITGLSEMDVRTEIRTLEHLMNPLRGDGKLRVTAPDGSQRELTCRYLSGLQLNEEKLYLLKQTAPLVFRAPDPYWYDTQTNVFTYVTGGQPATFFPFFPLRLSSSTVFTDASVSNLGDVEAWPEWIITGPGDSITLRNLTTGETITLNTTIGTGEQITIDTKPGKKTIRKNDGTNLFGSQSFDSSLWALQPGSNSIRIEVSNTTTASSVQLSYRNRYLGA